MDDDHLRAACIAAAASQGLTAYAIAARCEIDPGTVSRYFTGRCSLNSRYVSRICDVLGLSLTSTARQRTR